MTRQIVAVMKRKGHRDPSVDDPVALGMETRTEKSARSAGVAKSVPKTRSVAIAIETKIDHAARTVVKRAKSAPRTRNDATAIETRIGLLDIGDQSQQRIATNARNARRSAEGANMKVVAKRRMT